jgi:diguanylate cyclase (GGDEF)-like protein
MLDIDHFKRINDSYGHQVGDAAIRLMAATLREFSREVDICGRYGGEEFVAILPGTNKEGALVFCERLRLGIAGRSLEGPHKEVVKFTISLGAAEFDINSDSSLLWLRRVDQALYRAKDNGRNQTQID